MIAKKKQILTATLVLALVCAVGVNWYYSRPGNNPVSAATTAPEEQNLGDSLLVAGSVKTSEQTTGQNETADNAETQNSQAFAQAQLNKTKAHDEIKQQIEKLMNSESLDTESKNKLTKLMTDFTGAVKKESDCESLISAKTGTAQVILKKNSLDEATILQITEIIEKNTNISAENLTIIESK